MSKFVDLDNETIIEAVEEITEESKIFDQEQIDYVDALTGQIILNDVKGQMMNIIEGIGLPDKQETAIKRQITNALHETHREIGSCLEMVKASKQ